jgi:3-oxoacyl-[acyl-carrier-protein] synthase II
LNVNRIGVIFSSGIGGFETFEHEVIDYAKGNFQPKFNPFFITKIISNGLSGIISINYGLRELIIALLPLVLLLHKALFRHLITSV